MRTSGGGLVLWARHGENEANLTRRFSHRRLDLDLTARGRAQAQQLAAGLACRLSAAPGSPALFSSPLRRAQQTAQIVAARLGAEPEVLDGLREVDVGDLDGRGDVEAWQVYESVRDDWRHARHERRFTGGEDWQELCARLRGSLREIAAATRGNAAVVVAHGANLRAALPGLAHVPDPGSDLGTGQFADLQVTATARGARIRLRSWPAGTT